MRSFARASILLAPLLASLASAGCSAPAPDPLGEGASPILRGRAATLDEVYGTVALMSSADGEEWCTGTLIAPTVVVSAAHCVVDEESPGGTTDLSPSEFFVVAGALDAYAPAPEQRYDVRALARHPGFPGYDDPSDPDGLGREDDISVLLLAAPVVGVSPVPVLPMAEVDTWLVPGDPVVIAGYGDRDLAGDQYGQLYLGETPYVRRNDAELLAGDKDSPDTCLGDSGGPAYVDAGGHLALVGATSRAGAASVEECGEGGIYTLVPAYEEWLVANAQGEYTPGAAGGGGAGGSDDEAGGGGEGGDGDPSDDGSDDGSGEEDPDAEGSCAAAPHGAGAGAGTGAWALAVAAVAARVRRRRGRSG
jgi:hypothetical protein